MGATANLERFVIAALIGLMILLVLTIGVKLQATLAILISAMAIGLMAGMPYSAILESAGTGMGNTLKGIALPVELGSMFGAILEISDGAQRIATTLAGKFGGSKAAWTLGITGLVIATPVFFDAGLITPAPLAFSLAKKTKRSTLYYAIPPLVGLTIGHAFIPPTPGPVLMANILGVELGYVIIVGLLAGTVAIIVAGPMPSKFIGSKVYVPIPKNMQEMGECDGTKLPEFLTMVSIILIPPVLIILSIISRVVPAMAGVQPVLTFIGEPFIALTTATLVAMIALGIKHGYSREELERVMTESLEPTGMVLLVTACGGVLRYVLQDSGLDEVIGNAVAGGALPLVVVVFVVAALVRISIGPVTVAMTMDADIIAAMPGIASLSLLHLTCVTAAIADDAIVMSHFNDSGFWLMKSLLQIDEKATLKNWTVVETLVEMSGFVVALVTSFSA